MQRILSEVLLVVLIGSVVVSAAGCDPATEGVDEFAEREADLVNSPDGATPLTPPNDEMPADVTPDDENGGECLCPDVYKPVCGVDGETYSSACFAGCADVEIEHTGQCECVCNLIYAPVCGADGETYGNACAAGCAGVEVNYDGKCTGDSCVDDSECLPNQFCQRDGACGGEGICEIRPDACGKGNEVCGCDGELYESVCMAHVQGVSVAPDGPCQVIDPAPPQQI